MGRAQGPAVTKGNLFFSLFLVVAPAQRRRLRPRGRQPGGAGFTHTQPPTCTLARTHTHPVVMWGGKRPHGWWVLGVGTGSRFFQPLGGLAAEK